LLFYKKFYPFTYSYRRLAGQNHSGKITSWHRLSIKYQRINLSPFVQGVFKIYRQLVQPNHQHLVGLAVSSYGILSTVVVVQNSSSYLYYSFRPSLIVKGSTMMLKWIPVGTKVCWLMNYAHSGGTYIQILRHRQLMTKIRLPSKKERWVSSYFLATIGLNGNSKYKQQKLTKAGDRLFLGRRPVVRGVAMNPIDHPHGGGQGKTSGGRPSCTPWGQLTKGYKTVRHQKKKRIFLDKKFMETS